MPADQTHHDRHTDADATQGGARPKIREATPGVETSEARGQDAVTTHAMECAVMMEVHAAISTTTRAKGREIDTHFPAYDDLLAALDHPLLRQLFGEIEDSGTPEAARLWGIAMTWFDVRDPALAFATRREPSDAGRAQDGETA